MLMLVCLTRNCVMLWLIRGKVGPPHFFAHCTAILTGVSLPHAPHFRVVEYHSSIEERHEWAQHSLPVDEIAEENAILLRAAAASGRRYPLIVDPSGQATTFLLSFFASKQISRTSFTAATFRKDLEAALRFGTPLLVDDVEHLDPILNPLLNRSVFSLDRILFSFREIRKSGGRVLIRLGDQDIDFSPSFVLYLSTRDPAAHFTPDLCSRVTLINFTVTQHSLQAQCLDRVLREVCVFRLIPLILQLAPALYQQRRELLQVEGDTQQALRRLEKELLTVLNRCSGKLLDDDEVLTALEALQRDALSLKVLLLKFGLFFVQKKAEENAGVAAEVAAHSATYQLLSTAAARLFFALQELPKLHVIYTYATSLSFFLGLFGRVLALPRCVLLSQVSPHSFVDQAMRRGRSKLLIFSHLSSPCSLPASVKACFIKINSVLPCTCSRFMKSYWAVHLRMVG